jgi:hypothetical protein
MQTKEFSTTDHSDVGGWIATHKALAAGLWIGALGILLQAVTGATSYPKVPPGIPILAVVGLIVYFTPRWRGLPCSAFFLRD